MPMEHGEVGREDGEEEAREKGRGEERPSVVFRLRVTVGFH